jgi:hypothetical protein
VPIAIHHSRPRLRGAFVFRKFGRVESLFEAKTQSQGLKANGWFFAGS